MISGEIGLHTVIRRRKRLAETFEQSPQPGRCITQNAVHRHPDIANKEALVSANDSY